MSKKYKHNTTAQLAQVRELIAAGELSNTKIAALTNVPARRIGCVRWADKKRAQGKPKVAEVAQGVKTLTDIHDRMDEIAKVTAVTEELARVQEYQRDLEKDCNFYLQEIKTLREKQKNAYDVIVSLSHKLVVAETALERSNKFPSPSETYNEEIKNENN